MAIDMEACMRAATPGEAHQRLEQFAGTWKATAQIRHRVAPIKSERRKSFLGASEFERNVVFMKVGKRVSAREANHNASPRRIRAAQR